MRALPLALLMALALPVHADDLARERREAAASQAADLATTAAGLALGAVESNPLGLALIVPKVVGYARIKAAPETEQPALWSAYQSFGWGAAANNLCVIAAIASGGPAIVPCAAVGVVAGLVNWVSDKPRRERETFDAICDEQRTQNPALVCVFNGEVRP